MNKQIKPPSASKQIPNLKIIRDRVLQPLTNYTLPSVCPACARDTYRLACKVRCSKCGLMWDCSEL